eukprot:scaffold310123_cov22-Prasinocladus_malaysianus.AAC.1
MPLLTTDRIRYWLCRLRLRDVKYQDVFFGDMATLKEDPLSPKFMHADQSSASTSFSMADRRTKSVDFTSPR